MYPNAQTHERRYNGLERKPLLDGEGNRDREESWASIELFGRSEDLVRKVEHT
jgi:hypothetical protein